MVRMLMASLLKIVGNVQKIAFAILQTDVNDIIMFWSTVFNSSSNY
jgi:hypothetical protein